MLKIDYPIVKRLLEAENAYFYPINQNKYYLAKNEQKFELSLQESTIRDLKTNKITPINDFKEILTILNNSNATN